MLDDTQTTCTMNPVKKPYNRDEPCKRALEKLRERQNEASCKLSLSHIGKLSVCLTSTSCKLSVSHIDNLHDVMM